MKQTLQLMIFLPMLFPWDCVPINKTAWDCHFWYNGLFFVVEILFYIARNINFSITWFIPEFLKNLCSFLINKYVLNTINYLKSSFEYFLIYLRLYFFCNLISLNFQFLTTHLRVTKNQKNSITHLDKKKKEIYVRIGFRWKYNEVVLLKKKVTNNNNKLVIY